jgi:hypothetical protein
MHQLLKDLRINDTLLNCYAAGEYIHLSFKNSSGENESLLTKYLQEKGQTDLVFKETVASVEDCFIRLLGNPDGNSN